MNTTYLNEIVQQSTEYLIVEFTLNIVYVLQYIRVFDCIKNEYSKLAQSASHVNFAHRPSPAQFTLVARAVEAKLKKMPYCVIKTCKSHTTKHTKAIHFMRK